MEQGKMEPVPGMQPVQKLKGAKILLSYKKKVRGEGKMIKVKTFTSQLRIFQGTHELSDLDRAVNDFISSGDIKNVISVSDAVTPGIRGEAAGIIRVLTYEE